MSEHEHVHATHARTRQGAAHRQLVRAGVHQHRAAAVPEHDRIALPDVERHDLASARRSRPERQRHARHEHDGPHASRRVRPGREGPHDPRGCRSRERHTHQQPPALDGDGRPRQARHHMRDLRRQAHDRGPGADRQIARGGPHAADDRPAEPQPESHRHEGRRVRVRDRRHQRDHAERPGDDRGRRQLGHEGEREHASHGRRGSPQSVREPARGKPPEDQQRPDCEHGELESDVEDRPRLDGNHHHDRGRERGRRVPASPPERGEPSDHEHHQRAKRRVRHPGRHRVRRARGDHRPNERGPRQPDGPPECGDRPAGKGEMRARHGHQVREPENPEVFLHRGAHESPAVAEHDALDEVAPVARHAVHPLEHALTPCQQRPHDPLAPGTRPGAPRRARRACPSPGDSARPRLIGRKRSHDGGESHHPAEFRHVLFGRPPPPHARSVERSARDAHAHHRPERPLGRVGLDHAGPLASAAVGRER